MKYACIIIDDNIIERDALALKLKQIKSLYIHATLQNGLEAVTIIENNQIDIVFSDIDTPDLSGIALLKSISKPPVFIFISAYSEYAAESFDLDVIDYIVKPVRLERLIQATNKAIDYIQSKRSLNKKIIPKALSTIAGSGLLRTIDAQDYFFIKEANGYTKLDMGDVLYIESMGDFSKIYTISHQMHLVLVSLKNLEKQLPEKIFMRVHKQYIINLLHIKNITAGDIILRENKSVPVSAAHKQVLLDNVVHKKTLTRFSD